MAQGILALFFWLTQRTRNVSAEVTALSSLITNRLGQHRQKNKALWGNILQKTITHCCSMCRPTGFLYVCRGNYISDSVKTGWRFGTLFFFSLNLALDRIAREKAICVWLLSLASPEPGWAWASKCQWDKDQAWQTDTGVLSFHVSSLC